MSLYRRRKDGVWYARFEVDGREHRKSTRTRNRRVAEQIEDKLRDESASGRFGASERRRTAFRRAAEKWLEGKVAIGPRTREDYEKLVRALNPQIGHKLVTAITPDDISALQRLRKTEGTGPRRINYEVSIIRQVLSFVGEWERLRAHVSWFREPTNVGRAVDQAQEERILDAAARSGSPALLPLVILSLDTGLRRSELRRLRRGDLRIEWKNGLIVDGGLVVRKSKTTAGEGRYIPLTTRAKGTLSLWLSRPELGDPGSDDFVFPRHGVMGAGPRPKIHSVDNGRPIGEWKTAWYRALEIADLHFRWHDLRHTFVTRLAESPHVSEETIRALAGHVSKAMLSRYSHIRNRAKHEAIAALEAASSGIEAAQNPAHPTETDSSKKSLSPRIH